MEALPGFDKDPAVALAISQGPVAIQLTQAQPDGLFRQSKEVGDVTFYACGLVMDINKWTLAELEDIFDDTMGVAGFLGKAEDQSVYTF